MGRSRGGLTSKIHALVDTNGLPIRLALTAGEAHDNRLAGKLLSRLKPGTMLLADRGYDADWIRALASERGVWANIPPRCNRIEPICFSPHLYRARNLVERFFNKIKQCRRVADMMHSISPSCLGPDDPGCESASIPGVPPALQLLDLYQQYKGVWCPRSDSNQHFREET
jgi:transposase